MQIHTFRGLDGEVVECVKFTTESGVTAWVDTTIPMEALLGLQKKLEARLANYRRQSEQDSDLAEDFDTDAF